MRLRQISSDATQPCVTTIVHSDAGGSSTSSTTAYVGVQDCVVRRTWDVLTPGWPRQQRRGTVVMNPFESRCSEISGSSSRAYVFATFQLQNGKWVPMGSDSVSTSGLTSRLLCPREPMAAMSDSAFGAELALFRIPDISAIQSTLLAQALEKASAPNALALVTLAELDKTVDAFKSVGRASVACASFLESLGPRRVQQLKEAIRAYAKLTPGQARRQFVASLVKGVGKSLQTWLFYRYAIMTTIYEFNSYVSAFDDAGKSRSRVVTVANVNYQGNPVITSTSNAWASRRTVTTRSGTCKVSAGVLIQATPSVGAPAIGFDRPLATVWELIPFSFVLDWFVDAGTRISAWEGTLHLKPLGTWSSFDHQMIYTSTTALTGMDTINGSIRYTGTGVSDASTFERFRWRSRTANPSLGLIPQLSVKLNWKRVLDSVALIAGASRRIAKL